MDGRRRFKDRQGFQCSAFVFFIYSARTLSLIEDGILRNALIGLCHGSGVQFTADACSGCWQSSVVVAVVVVELTIVVGLHLDEANEGWPEVGECPRRMDNADVDRVRVCT